MNRGTSISSLPSDGGVLWRGRPAFWAAAIRIWKVRIAAIYFAALLADGGRIAVASSRAVAGAWTGEAKLLAIGAAAIGGLLILAALTSRTTVYAVEERGIVMRIGVALPATLVIPYGAIERVDVRMHRDRTGDVALRLKPGRGVLYPKLWPHARPWRIARAEPMLRGVKDAGVVGPLICQALVANQAQRAAQAPQRIADEALAA